MSQLSQKTCFIAPGWENSSILTQILNEFLSVIISSVFYIASSDRAPRICLCSLSPGRLQSHRQLHWPWHSKETQFGPLMISSIKGCLIGTGTVAHCTEPLSLQVIALHHKSISFLVTVTIKHLIILRFHWMSLDDPQMAWQGNYQVVWAMPPRMSASSKPHCCCHLYRELQCLS